MSKKDRLKKQSLKQIEQKKAAARAEDEEREKAGESRAAKKLRKSAKKHSGALTLGLKILMCVPYAWSGIWYCIIFLVGISIDTVDEVPKSMAVYLGLGSLVCLAGIVFAFLSKYRIQFGLILLGTALYMHSAWFIIDKTKERINAGHGLTDDQLGLASKWRLGFYPMLIVTAISTALMLMYVLKKRAKKKRRQQELDNAPTKSIVE